MQDGPALIPVHLRVSKRALSVYGKIEVEPGGEISDRLAVGDGHATEIAVAVEARQAEEHELGVDDGNGADGLTEPGVSET